MAPATIYPFANRTTFLEYLRLDQSAYPVPDTECPICRDPYTSSTSPPTTTNPSQPRPFQLPCTHIFCRACLETWTSSSPTCPICRLVLYQRAPRNMSAWFLEALEIDQQFGFGMPVPYEWAPRDVVNRMEERVALLDERISRMERRRRRAVREEERGVREGIPWRQVVERALGWVGRVVCFPYATVPGGVRVPGGMNG